MGRSYFKEEVFRRIGEGRSFLKVLKIRKAKLIGHILRHNNLLDRIIVASIKGKNTRGRPPLEYISQLVKNLRCSTYYVLKQKAKKAWRLEKYFQPAVNKKKKKQLFYKNNVLLRINYDSQRSENIRENWW